MRGSMTRRRMEDLRGKFEFTVYPICGAILLLVVVALKYADCCCCRYNTSKLLEVLFVRELVKHTSKLPVITTVNPGFCESDLGRDYSALEVAILNVLKFLLARTTEVGSRNLVAGACAGEASHGMYMSDCQNHVVAGWIETEEGAKVQKSVYEQTLAVLEKIEPGVSKNI